MGNAKYILLSDAGEWFPHPPAYSTLRRYVDRGLNGVRLQVVRSAGRVLTTPEWIEQFVLISSRRDMASGYNQDQECQSSRIGSARRLQRAGIHVMKTTSNEQKRGTSTAPGA